MTSADLDGQVANEHLESLLLIHEADHRLRFGLHRKGISMTRQISRNRSLESLKEAANSCRGRPEHRCRPRKTELVAARADGQGSSYFQDLSERNPATMPPRKLSPTWEELRAAHGVDEAILRLDKAATIDFGKRNCTVLPRPGSGETGTEGGPSEVEGAAAADTGPAGQVVADLEFVLGDA